MEEVKRTITKTCVVEKMTQVFFATAVLVANVHASVDPWSKIVVTSKKATCNKDKNNPKDFIFSYIDDVVVTLADKSTVKAGALEIILDGNKSDKKDALAVGQKQASDKQKKSLSQFKKLSFKGHVVLNSGQRKVSANKADIDLAKNTCTLDGNVKIWQFKKHQKDVPIAIESQKAVMHLKTFAVNLLGTSAKPVSTTIDLEGHPSVQKKTKTKSKGKKKSA